LIVAFLGKNWMLALGLAMVLAVLSVAAFPCWRHSAGWGYGPTLSVGVLLLAVAVATASARTSVTHALTKSSAVPLRVSAEDVRMATLVGTEIDNVLRQ
jgi:hypothetical protein